MMTRPITMVMMALSSSKPRLSTLPRSTAMPRPRLNDSTRAVITSINGGTAMVKKGAYSLATDDWRPNMAAPVLGSAEGNRAVLKP